MKKLLCSVLVLMLCLTAFALADSTASKTTSDLTSATTSVPSKTTSDLADVATDADFTLSVILADDTANADLLAVAESELAKLADLVSAADDATAAIEEYFGEVVDAEGNVIDLSDALSASALAVNEFAPIVVADYDITIGDVVVTFTFATPYDADEAVLVLIGLYDATADAATWTAFEGVGTGEDGAVQVTLTADTLSAAQDGTALLAIVSVDD